MHLGHCLTWVIVNGCPARFFGEQANSSPPEFLVQILCPSLVLGC